MYGFLASNGGTKNSPSASPDLSVDECFQRFNSEKACVEDFMTVRFGGTRFDCPKCGIVESTIHKLQKRRTCVCASCGRHVKSTAGAIRENTRTQLVNWYYAIYLFCTTRHGVSGKELQRQLGVTYTRSSVSGMGDKWVSYLFCLRLGDKRVLVIAIGQ